MNMHKFFPGISRKKARPVSQAIFRWAMSLVIMLPLLAGMMGALGLHSTASAQQQGEKTANYLPPDTDLYLTINVDLEGDQLSNFLTLVNNWLVNPNVKAKLDELLNKFTEESGINIKGDILPWLGPEIAAGLINITPQDLEQPEFIIFLGTMDKTASDAAFEKYKAWAVDRETFEDSYTANGTSYQYKSGLTFSSATYRGQSIAIAEHWYQIDDNARITAGTDYYGFTDAYILFSLSESALYDTIDMIMDGGDSLAGTANFKTAQTALPERAGMFYLNTGAFLGDIAGMIPEEETGLSRQMIENLIEAYDSVIPAYFAASLKFTGTGIAGTGFFPVPEAVNFPATQAAELKAAAIVPGDALFYASVDAEAWWMAFTAYSEALWSQAGTLITDSLDKILDEAIASINEDSGLNVEDIWTQDIAPQLENIAGMSPVEAVTYLNNAFNLNLQEIWTQTAPSLKILSAMGLAEAIVSLDDNLDLNLEEEWARIAPKLGELSGMSLEQALTRITEVLGLDKIWEEKIAPKLKEVSEMDYPEAIVSLLMLEGRWDKITAHLDALSARSLKEAIRYFLLDIVKKPLDEARARVNEAITDSLGECAIVVLPEEGMRNVPLIISEVKDVGAAQQKLDRLTELLKLFMPVQVSQQTIKGVTAIIFQSDSLTEAKLSPGYLFLDIDSQHYLVFGPTINSLEEAVNAKQTPQESLSQADEYQGLLFQLGDVRGSLVYLNLTGMIENNTAISKEAEILGFLPLQSALGFTNPLLGENSITMTGALYLLPPSLIEQNIQTGYSGSLLIPEQDFDLSSLKPELGQASVLIDVSITNAPANASIKVTVMGDITAEIRSGFELAATDKDLTIQDIAYVIRVDKVNFNNDNTGAATITLKVGKAWTDKYGIDNIRVLRIGDNGVQEVLPTTFKAYEGDQAIFEAVSANGLSYFGLAATSGSGGSNTALIAGIIAGVAVLLVAVTLVLLSRRKRTPEVTSSEVTQ